MDCRAGCGACCIAPSISSPIPGMPYGKPAGMPCVQLDEHYGCRIFGQPTRPAVCASLRPSDTMCGTHRDHAMAYLARLEHLTSTPAPPARSPA
ncbi:YkgJ family cysteine cluster protein [Arenimonas sp. MALMAid1274]|uniref:YkgJ family cysteine cluster protein n=1 Tax=Arenimonas sp. MALMAid1274 TaxID=3411630 RepID=UPI003B9F3096